MSELLEHIEIEVNILVLPEIGATKTDFKGEAVDDIEFFPQGNLNLKQWLHVQRLHDPSAQ